MRKNKKKIAVSSIMFSGALVLSAGGRMGAVKRLGAATRRSVRQRCRIGQQRERANVTGSDQTNSTGAQR